jgi:trehalose-phosphatase
MTLLDRRLEKIARADVLLIATDFDGTLAPIVSNPADARPHPESMVALRALVSLPRTHVAVVSGRALRDLERRGRFASAVHLVGSHGGEGLAGSEATLPTEAADRLRRILAELQQIAATAEGFVVESKPTSAAFHYRNAEAVAAAKAIAEIRSGPGSIPGVLVRPGSKVIELAVTSAHKGEALATLREGLGAMSVLFIGDDLTDEDAFRTLGPTDLGVKVGEGESAAAVRVADTRDVSRLLAEVFEYRCDWLESSDIVPIERHSLLSDQRTFALVTPGARVVWLCLPRLDSPALFAELLGGPSAGYFAIGPADGSPPSTQRYFDDSLVLETCWPDLTVTDVLDCSGGLPFTAAGHSRFLRTVAGTGRVRIEFAPRLDFGRVPTLLDRADDGSIVVAGTHEPLVLLGPGLNWSIEVDGDDRTAVAEIELNAETVDIELVFGEASRGTVIHARQRTAETAEWWRSRVAALSIPEFAADVVRRSALLLKALCYEPTGAIAAAATTSLPEHLGGVRNWDYRYCWIRDAALAAHALLDLGSVREADRFLLWLDAILEESGDAERLRPVYTVTGAPVPAEADIPELIGYRGSRPVRIGNAASEQFQLDVFGPVVALASRLAEVQPETAARHRAIISRSVRAVASRWSEPDHGIWEVRGPRRQYVYSKVMCWQAVDRAIAFLQRIGARPDPDWIHLRDGIDADISANGYRPELQTFTAAYDGTDLDAASLHVGLAGLTSPDDPRFIGTVAAVERTLLRGPVVQRYYSDDRLPGLEGGFNLCTSWLVRSLVLMGRTEDAHTLFNGMVAQIGPTGLMAEEWDPVTGDALGNVPQAYSHIGLIDAALALANGQPKASPRPA